MSSVKLNEEEKRLLHNAWHHFLTITQGRENLRALGLKTLWEGAQDVLFELA